jgi:nitrogen fixation protein NifQ
MSQEMLYPRRNGGLSAGHSQTAPSIGVWHLIGHNARPGDDLGGAFAWVIAAHCNPGSEVFVPALGMGPDAFCRLLGERFPHFSPSQSWLAAQGVALQRTGELEEFDDLLQLLLEHAASGDEHHRRVAHLVVTACMGHDHLWQDLGLPNRHALSTLLSGHFPALAAKNTGDMKWKKFFYKQLCERAEIFICKSPSCGVCCDYDKCFGPED